jgi:tetratricopeptide (TPR) repeat protein
MKKSQAMMQENTYQHTSPLHRAHDESINERPSKKSRVANSTEIVALLTDVGITLYGGGKRDEAHKCFSEALNQIDPQYSSVEIQSIYQPNQEALTYDEGIKMFDEPLRIDGTCLPVDATIAGKLIYNIALTYASRGQFQESLRWFEKSLEKISAGTTTHDMETVAKIEQNIAYCCFRLGLIEKALTHAPRALSLLTTLLMGRDDLAASLNSLAVLMFHSQTEDKKKALELLYKSLAIYKSISGCNKEIGCVLNNIGRILFLQEEYHTAIKIYEEAIQIR